jgi:hypothetical protein
VDLFSGIVGGIIAGSILLFVEYIIRRREKRYEETEQHKVKFTNDERRITDSIFRYLGPHSSVELMKSEFGPPNKKLKETGGVFLQNKESNKETYAYVYYFKNAQIKITSKNGDIIDSLTVEALDKDINFGNLFFNDPSKEQFLNVQTLTPEMLEEAKVEEFLGCLDGYSAVQKSLDFPDFLYLTYFCDYSGDGDVEQNSNLLSVL